MKNVVAAACAALAMLAGAPAFAGGKVVVGKGANRPMPDPGFAVEKFDANPRDVVTVDVSGGAARITGLREGQCVVKLIGAGNMEETYEVQVGTDLDRIRRELQYRLENVSGIEVSKRDDYLLVRGEVNDPDEWFRLRKIVAEPVFADVVKDDTEFRIQADVIKRFYDQLRNAGFEISTDGADAPEGVLRVRYEHKTVSIAGTVFSEGSLASLRQIVAEQSWLRLAGAEPAQGTDESWKPVCRLNVSLDQRLLHMDVVLVGYKETNEESYGSSDRPAISMTFRSFWDLIAGHAKNDSFRIDANLDSVLDFMKKNEISRHTTGGYMRFKCNDAEAARLKIGGTLKVKMHGATAEGIPNDNFEDIEYGFIVTKNEASLANGDTVRLKLNILQKTPEPSAAGYAEGYDVKENEYNPTVDCPLGKTVVIAGYRSFVQTTMPPSGFPVLRNVPIINWFVSQEGDLAEDMKLMMLVSVRAVRPDEPEQQDARLPYEESKNLTTEVQIDNNDRIEKRKADAARWDGWLFWLNWFTP